MKLLTNIRSAVWSQFGASLDMLERAIQVCPDSEWTTHPRLFYQIYHTLVFLDYYLTLPPREFSPPLPFSILPEEDRPREALGDVIPDRYYSGPELLEYLQHCRSKARNLISNLSEETLSERFVEEGVEEAMDFPVLEIILYNLRHVQHHTAQINLLLRQSQKEVPNWVLQAADQI